MGAELADALALDEADRARLLGQMGSAPVAATAGPGSRLLDGRSANGDGDRDGLWSEESLHRRLFG